MKLFKTTDEKLRELGFIKTDQDGHGASYERKMRNYTQVVALVRKKYGDAILQSYDRGLFDAGYTGNICVGLTYREARLFLRKMRELGLHYKNAQ